MDQPLAYRYPVGVLDTIIQRACLGNHLHNNSQFNKYYLCKSGKYIFCKLFHELRTKELKILSTNYIGNISIDTLNKLQIYRLKLVFACYSLEPHLFLVWVHSFVLYLNRAVIETAEMWQHHLKCHRTSFMVSTTL